MRDDLDAVRLAQQGLRDRTESHPGGGLPGTGALKDGAGVGEAVLLHPGQVGVAGPRPGQRGVTGQPRQLLGVDWVRRHDLAPFRPFGVTDDDAHRAAQGEAVAHAAEQLDLVTLEAHPRTAPVAETPTPEFVCDLGAGDADARR